MHLPPFPRGTPEATGALGRGSMLMGPNQCLCLRKYIIKGRPVSNQHTLPRKLPSGCAQGAKPQQLPWGVPHPKDGKWESPGTPGTVGAGEHQEQTQASK